MISIRHQPLGLEVGRSLSIMPPIGAPQTARRGTAIDVERLQGYEIVMNQATSFAVLLGQRVLPLTECLRRAHAGDSSNRARSSDRARGRDPCPRQQP